MSNNGSKCGTNDAHHDKLLNIVTFPASSTSSAKFARCPLPAIEHIWASKMNKYIILENLINIYN